MAGASITIENTASAGIASVVAKAERPDAMMSAIAAYMLFSTQRRFETQTGPDGKAWQSLSPRTAKARVGRSRQRGYDNILRVTTRLYRSLVAFSDTTTAQVGTNVDYAAIHQFGGEIQQPERAGRVTFKKIRGARGVRFVRAGTKGAESRDVTIGAHKIRMPARPYLGINADDIAEIEQIAIDALRQEADR